MHKKTYLQFIKRLDRIVDYIESLGEGPVSGESLAVLTADLNQMRRKITEYVVSEKTESTLERVLNSIDALIYVSDLATGEILFINKKMEDCFGLKNAVGKICWQVLQTGMTGVCDFCPVHALKDVDSAPIIWEEYNTVTNRTYQNTDRLIHWTNDRIVHIQHSVDITDLKEAIADRSAANEAIRMKNLFLANTSHEIRTPLNAIIGMSELLLAEALPSRLHDYVSDIRASGLWLLDIISDILDFTKIEEGKLALKPCEYQLGALLENLESIFRLNANQKGIEFSLSVQGELPRCILGDETRLRQILINLVGNAIKFTMVGRVDLAAKAENNMLIFTISDTGIGMKDEDRSKLYHAFTQFDNAETRAFNGTGLGLLITRKLVDMMHGQITVESEYGKGTVFVVEIPFIPGDIEKLNVSHSDFQFISAPDARILVVDDSDLNLTVAVGMLQLCGIAPDTASSAAECYEQIDKNHYDIVFMDHMMPGTDGVEATKRLRENGYSDLIIVAFTANTMGNAREMFLDSGMNDVLPKPLDKVQLNDILCKWLPPNLLKNTKKPMASGATAPSTHGLTMLDMDKQIQALGDEDLYYTLLNTYSEEMQIKTMEMTKALEKGDTLLFTTLVHSVKSSNALIGADIPSELAKKMEMKSREGDMDYVRKKLPELLRLLDTVTQEVQIILAEDADRGEDQRQLDGIDRVLLKNLYLACETMESLRIHSALTDLQKSDLSPDNKIFVNRISELLDAFELDKVMELLTYYGIE